MATYSAVSAGEKDADSPINVSLIDKLDQNPHAIAEGATGAPKIQSAALDADVVTGDKVADDAIDSEHIAADALELGAYKAPTSGTTYEILNFVGSTWDESTDSNDANT